MKHNFKNAKILVVNDHEASRKMQVNALRILGAPVVDEGYEMSDGFRKFKDVQHDVILASLDNGVNDAVGFAKLVRNDSQSPNKLVPVIAVTGPQAMHLVDAARDAGVTELLRAPYSIDALSNVLGFALSVDNQTLADSVEEPVKVAQPEEQATETWPNEEEASSLTSMLLEHYMKHHEIVFAKLKFAQGATKQCIDGLRDVHEKIKSHDNTSIHTFTDFDKMWEEVLGLFVQGGLGEEELFAIEKMISNIPKAMKEHYEDLSIQDKSFLKLVESLNTSGYQRAKEKVSTLQQQPSPLSGRTHDDMRAAVRETTKTPERKPITEDVYMLNPRRKK